MDKSKENMITVMALQAFEALAPMIAYGDISN